MPAPYSRSFSGESKMANEDLTRLRVIRKELREMESRRAALLAEMDDILELTTTSRPLHRKTLSGRGAAELIRSGGLRQ